MARSLFHHLVCETAVTRIFFAFNFPVHLRLHLMYAGCKNIFSAKLSNTKLVNLAKIIFLKSILSWSICCYNLMTFFWDIGFYFLNSTSSKPWWSKRCMQGVRAGQSFTVGRGTLAGEGSQCQKWKRTFDTELKRSCKALPNMAFFNRSNQWLPNID